MRKNVLLKLSAIAQIGIFALAFGFSSCSHTRHAEAGEGMDEDLDARIQWENRMLADPATGAIPENIRARELAFASTQPQYRALGKDGSDFWKSRGPWNVGGRTRAVAIDISNEHVILAGSVSGGIWRSTNDGASWTKVTPPSLQSNITCIVQNTRPGKQNIWYAGTGELIGNSASGSYAFYLGDGILKSTDGGLTWNKLTSTSSATPQVLSKDFDIVHDIAINTADTGDVVYAATFNCIYKSVNGGKTWVKERGSITSGTTMYTGSQYTDVTVTPGGVVYAVLSSDGTNKGIWRSTDGNTWVNITPAGFPAVYYRVVMGVAGSDENQIYFLGSTKSEGKMTTNFLKTPEWNTLWKYTYISGNGTGAGGKWEDRSQNLPSFGGDFGNFNSQGGYDLLVKVKPDDPNTVFIGGTNLWRSTDAFTSTKNITWTGGYGINTSLPNYQMYPNHHPDQHNLIFYPSDAKKSISTCDGGIFRTDDNTASSVTWSSLNNGYITSQFYSVAVDHATASNDEIIGGLQDNGSYFTSTSDQEASWAMSFNSDGCFSYITDNRTDYYASTQLGKVYRLHLDNTGNYTEAARVDPAGAKHRDFVNPWTFDPNNQKRMYFPSGSLLWKNDDVTQIPMHTVKDTVPVNTGWNLVNFKADTFITALSVSRKPADILYLGTLRGKVYRLDKSSSSSPVVKNITGKNFPVGANVNNICIDPDDANKAIIVFSNYSVVSLFYTTDGGTSWTNIASNLEQNANGSGNGPSCRWAAIMPVGQQYTYFVATSTGLYSTDTLKGSATVWTQQSPDGIGNTVCPMIDTRPSDGMVAVATHGNGIYTAHVTYPYQVTGVREGTAGNNGINIYPNPVHDRFNIIFDNDRAQVQISILDETGKYCGPVRNVSITGERIISVDMAGLPAGIYYCRINANDRTVTMPVVKLQE